MTADERFHKCPDCKCLFVQPFVCTTCGAQKLYDETVRSQAAAIEHLSLLNVEYAGKIDRLNGALQMIAEGLCPSLVPPMTAEQIARAALDVSPTQQERNDG